MRRVILVIALAALASCGPIGVAGDLAIGTGQVALGVADILI